MLGFQIFSKRRNKKETKSSKTKFLKSRRREFYVHIFEIQHQNSYKKCQSTRNEYEQNGKIQQNPKISPAPISKQISNPLTELSSATNERDSFQKPISGTQIESKKEERAKLSNSQERAKNSKSERDFSRRNGIWSDCRDDLDLRFEEFDSRIFRRDSLCRGRDSGRNAARMRGFRHRKSPWMVIREISNSERAERERERISLLNGISYVWKSCFIIDGRMPWGFHIITLNAILISLNCSYTFSEEDHRHRPDVIMRVRHDTWAPGWMDMVPKGGSEPLKE